MHLKTNGDNGENGGDVLLPSTNALPWVPSSMEQERKDGKLWRELNDGMKLMRAVNLASWHPLGGQRHWPTDAGFVLRFGSVLPAKEALLLPCQVAECVLVMKFYVTTMASEEIREPLVAHALTELSMRIEDMMLPSEQEPRRRDGVVPLASYLRAQSELREETIRSECRFDTVCVFRGIAVFAALCTMWYRKKLESL